MIRVKMGATFAKTVRNIALLYDGSKGELAVRLGVNRQVLHEYEEGKLYPTKQRLDCLLDACGVRDEGDIAGIYTQLIEERMAREEARTSHQRIMNDAVDYTFAILRNMTEEKRQMLLFPPEDVT